MNAQLSLSELWTYSESLESRVNSYWNFFAVLVVAFAGWILSHEKPFPIIYATVMIASFITFAFMNLFVMRAATLLLVGITEEIKVRAKEVTFETVDYRKHATSQLLRNRVGFSYVLHLVCDVAVITLIIVKCIGK